MHISTILYSAPKKLSAEHQPVEVAGFVVAYVRAELLIGIDYDRAMQAVKLRDGETLLNTIRVPAAALSRRLA